MGVQGFLAELSAWAASSGRTPQTYRYGARSENEADLLLPEGRSGPHPVAVLVHGGFWRARFTRTLMSALAVDLAKRGWATWNVEYRRVGTGGGVPETLHDVRAAIEALVRLEEARIAPRRLLVIGHSAGGQLGLCVTGMPQVAAVLSLAGVCDLGAAARERIGEGAALEFMGGTPEEQPDAYAIADPMRLLPTRTESLLVHGDADQRVPIEQSRAYARAARAAGDRCELLELADIDHFAVIDPRTQAWATVADHLDRLLSRPRGAAGP